MAGFCFIANFALLNSKRHMATFHKLQVNKVNKETHDTVSISFSVPSNLTDNFKFIQGQYLTLRLNVNGESLNRSYSLCSSPYNGEDLTVAVKRVDGGRASNYLNDQVQAGSEIEVMEPMGNFYTQLDSSNSKHYYLFGGGSGITPMLSIIKSVISQEPNSKMTLFYGNRDEKSIIFRQVLDKLASEHQDRLKIVHIIAEAGSDWNGYTGMMTQDVVMRLIRENTSLSFGNAEMFICGPSPMMAEVKHALETMSVPKEKVHIEYFTAKDPSDDVESASVGTSTGDAEPLTGNTSVKIIYDGKEREFEMGPDDTVLEAALDAGFDPPYACMVAACCTCRAKLLSGQVEMDDRESLTDDEIEEGYVLTCQAHPKSHGVVLNFDE